MNREPLRNEKQAIKKEQNLFQLINSFSHFQGGESQAFYNTDDLNKQLTVRSYFYGNKVGFCTFVSCQ